MINDCMETNKLIGMIQPKILKNENLNMPELYKIGCMGKIINSEKTDDGRYLIELKGMIRFKIVNEIVSNKKYRECEISFDKFYDDLEKHINSLSEFS